MNDLKKVTHGILWMAAACLCASPLAAQQESGDKPKPAAYQYSLLLNTADNQQDADQQITSGVSIFAASQYSRQSTGRGSADTVRSAG